MNIARPPKLLDQMREALRSRHYSRRTEQTYCQWVKRYIFFHKVRHPAEMAEPEINAFLTHLAVKEKVSASTQNQALSALLFLYRHVLGREVGDLGEVIRARKPTRLPVVMARDEVKAVLANLSGDKRLMASLMYGAGLRLMECLQLRVQDIDFSRNEIIVRDGKGAKNRVTMLPASLKVPLLEHLKRVKSIHEHDLADGWGCVLLPDALDRKYRAEGMVLAVGFPLGKSLEKPEDRRRGAASRGRVPCAEVGSASCHVGGADEASYLPHLPAFLRYTSS
uniref:Integron integrase n=2 Tax=unclassified Candidatus Kentrum TaxID=2643149 RepID=A0A450XY78_9GAMM|nr:MAG: integron integrase [Candidatus Kentron sp. MB]VFK34258.1 MAG: integron integrase [Candidatus Kentron sp. MB]VFK76618.1 MAG: integron integrase [Candidatus Kentron sp. MB]